MKLSLSLTIISTPATRNVLVILGLAPLTIYVWFILLDFQVPAEGGPRGPLFDITNFISVKVQTKRQWGTVIYIFSYVLHKFNSCLGATLRENYVL